MKAKLNVGVPVLCMSCFPILLLAFPTESTIARLWSAAMMVLSTRIGMDVAPWIARKAALWWLAADAVVLVVLMSWGVLDISAASLGYRVGSLAAMQVGLFLPIGILLSGLFENRRKPTPVDSPKDEEGSS